MRYRNISDKPQRIVKNRVKTLVRPDGVINIDTPDRINSGGSLRFFEAIDDRPENKVVKNIKDLPIEKENKKTVAKTTVDKNKEEAPVVEKKVDIDENKENSEAKEFTDTKEPNKQVARKNKKENHEPNEKQEGSVETKDDQPKEKAEEEKKHTPAES